MDFCTGKSKVFIVCLIQNGIYRQIIQTAEDAFLCNPQDPG